MSNEIDWSKAPEGYPIWIEDLKPGIFGDMGGWHREESDRYVDDKGAFWSKPEDGFYRVYRNPAKSAWTGTGLPPVGTVCEFHGGAPDPADPWHPALKDAAEVTVIAHYNNMGVDVAVFTFADTRDGIYGMQVEQAVAGCFRPIRTPEQIAAEEREKAILEMVKDSGSPAACLHPMPKIFGRLYDAGYRKTEGEK